MKTDKLVGDSQYYSALATRAREQYNQTYSVGYREHDELYVDTPSHADFGELLTKVSESFGHPIEVLDLGCGAGRYFHRLRNAVNITGVDVSPDMLKQAQHPVRESVILAPLTLVCDNISAIQFKEDTFDLVYSIGVLGEYCPFDSYMCAKFARLLKSGGRFVFTVIDKESPHTISWKRRTAEILLPVLPLRLKLRVTVRLCSLALSEAELRSILDQAQLSIASMEKRYSPRGRIHLVCVTRKG